MNTAPLAQPETAADLHEGQAIPVGIVRLTRAEIVAFAEQFDPQPFHLDDAAAAASIFKGLSASGFHTLSACFGAQVRSGVFARCNLGGRGMESLRWLQPVRPDTDYALSLEIRAIKSNPARGRADVAVGYVLRDAAGAAVLDATILHVMRWPAA